MGKQRRHPGSSNSSTGSAPTSVMCLPASPLARELSDLSGSYMNGNTAPRGGKHANHLNSNSSRAGVPTTIASSAAEVSIQGPWRQAHLLSSPPPKEMPYQKPAPALIVVERNGVIELVKNTQSDKSADSDGNDDERDDGNDSEHDKASPSPDILRHLNPPQEDSSHTRIPIIILLMDPGRRQYELMQLWVDTKTDSVRDVLHTLQRKLSDKWRQDYDGLFQPRGEQYCQLVHIFGIAKYDVQQRELWVAKPWSMAAKTT
jgi:hypothetical protein